MFADDLTETLLVQMIHTMGENGIDIGGKEFVRDIGFVIEAVKGTIYRDMQLAHLLQLPHLKGALEQCFVHLGCNVAPNGCTKTI